MKKIIILLLILLIPLVSADSMYFVQIDYDNEKLSYQKLNVIQGEQPDYLDEPKEGYKGIIIDFNNKKLFELKFNIPLRIFDVPGIIFLNESSKSLILPYFNTGKYLNIYDPKEELKLQIDLSRLALCDENYKCEGKENHENCHLDCITGGKDKHCDFSMDGICDKDCKGNDFECEEIIIDEKTKKEIIKMYEKEIEFYKNLTQNKNIKEQITQREERINNLKKKEINLDWIIILAIIIAIFLTYKKLKYKKKWKKKK